VVFERCSFFGEARCSAANWNEMSDADDGERDSGTRSNAASSAAPRVRIHFGWPLVKNWLEGFLVRVGLLGAGLTALGSAGNAGTNDT